MNKSYPVRSMSSKALFFSHSSALAGAELSMLELVKELTSDYETICTVILPSYGPLEKLLQQAGAATLIAPINRWCAGAEPPDKTKIGQLYSQSLGWLNENLHILSQINPDVVLTNTLVIPWGALAASLLKRPHIWMVNEFGELDHGLKFFLPFPQILSFIDESSDKIVTCSKVIQKELFPHLDSNKIKTIYYNIDIPDKRSIAEVPKDSYFLTPDACHLIISGFVMKSKGQEDAVHAVIELIKNRKRKVELVIAGNAQPDYQNYLEKIINTEDVSDFIHIIPFQENVISIVNSADIVLVCSRMEGFGRVTLEAMLMEKAVVAANTGGTKEMIFDGETGLLYTPGDYTGLADQIEKLLDDPSERLNLAHNAYRFARKNFTKEKFGGEYHKILMDLKNGEYQNKEEMSWFLTNQYQILLEQTEAGVQALTAQLADKEQAVQALTAQLAETINSKAWKIALLFRRIRVLIAPPNSRRASVLRGVINVFVFRLIRVNPNRNPEADLALIQSSGLFAETWYLSNNPDVAQAKADPLLHYLNYGGFEGRDPGPNFSSGWYLNTYVDARAAGISPLVHYLKYGKNEGRSPFPNQAINTNLQNRVSRDSKSLQFLPMVRRYLLQHSHFFPFVRTIVLNAMRVKISKYLVHNQDNVDGAPSSREGSPALVRPQTHEDNLMEYETLSRKTQEIVQQQMKEVSVKAPRLISFGEDHLTLMQAAKPIKFPTSLTPKVSVVIPVHNKANLLLECMISLQNDIAFKNFEICVVDDFSDGENREIIESIRGIKLVRNQERRGFGSSCNIGAQASKGEFLVFLNDDVQVTGGAINSLLHTFETRSDVGAVGPKVLYPSGFLQEAGCVINPDGTVALIGHGDDPTLPRYNYLREVDQVSGVCLMIKKDQFNAVGGFEEAYAIAYYEDVDLGFKLREKGLKVFYNPESVIVHHLSATTSGLYGQKIKLDLVARNRQKLLERWQLKIDELNQIRLIAFYSPQFHPIPENDLWWGRGFTEWANVVRARSCFHGHYQPHLPADLGFYDLRDAEIMEQQAKLAERYGIYGFCYHYYWFNGKRLFEMPLERMLKTGRPDFPFCLCWANENWPRRWDGGEKDILIAQKYSDKDDLSVIRDLIRYFKHPNYIRVDGKPMFLVHQVNVFPDFKRTARIWRDECRRQGIGEIYLVMAVTFELAFRQYDPKEFGVDAAVEFPPHGKFESIRPANKASGFRGRVMDYKNMALHFMTKNFPDFFYYKTVMPSWDNTARRKNNAGVFAKSSPGAYQAWLEEAIRRTHEQYAGDHRMVFINAWNEWAEGNHLEPDQRYGHGFLEATKNALEYRLIRSGLL
jgi:GT2 family glycosyltransferase/glycosyltransferase involved in cell wall biosynthesis